MTDLYAYLCVQQGPSFLRVLNIFFLKEPKKQKSTFWFPRCAYLSEQDNRRSGLNVILKKCVFDKYYLLFINYIRKYIKFLAAHLLYTYFMKL